MRYFVPILVTFTFLLFTTFVFAESLSVSMTVGSTNIAFSGYTSPNSQVVIKEDGSVVGTTTSNSIGNWTKTISVSTPTLHSYDLYATDTLSLSTATVTYSLNVIGNTTTNIDNIVLPPTITSSLFTISGSAYPSSTITLTSSSGDTYSLTVAASGLWTYDLSSLTGGPYTITAINTVGSYLSINSTSLSFNGPTPSSAPASSTPSPSSASSEGSPSTTSPSPSPSPTPTPKQLPFFIKLYDTNSDDTLSLTELIAIVTNWLSGHLPCDLNKDKTCSLVDLSILLYYIGR